MIRCKQGIGQIASVRRARAGEKTEVIYNSPLTMSQPNRALAMAEKYGAPV